MRQVSALESTWERRGRDARPGPESAVSGRLFRLSLAPRALPRRSAARISASLPCFLVCGALSHSPRYVGWRPSGPHSQLSRLLHSPPAVDSGLFVVAFHNLVSPRALASGDHDAPGLRAGIDLGATWPRRESRISKPNGRSLRVLFSRFRPRARKRRMTHGCGAFELFYGLCDISGKIPDPARGRSARQPAAAVTCRNFSSERCAVLEIGIRCVLRAHVLCVVACAVSRARSPIS